MAKRGKKRRRSKPPAKPPKPQAALLTQGQCHDLLEIYNAVNRQYFNNKIRIRITWRREQHGRPCCHQSIQMGTCHVEDRLITIHRALDRYLVPRFFVELIVFHEMLHIKYPPLRKNGRDRIFPPISCIQLVLQIPSIPNGICGRTKAESQIKSILMLSIHIPFIANGKFWLKNHLKLF